MHEIERQRSDQRFYWTAASWIVLLVSPLAVCPLVAQAKPDVPDLSAVRSALKKYQDPYVAVHDGYFSTLGCVEIARAGGAGQVPYKPGGMGSTSSTSDSSAPCPIPANPRC